MATDGKKANSVITTKLVGTIMTFSVVGAGDLTLDLETLGQAVRVRALAHGRRGEKGYVRNHPRSDEAGMAGKGL